MISCRNCWPWTKPCYITKTRRQSNNQWSGSIATLSAQKLRVQKSAEKILASFYWDLPHWLSSKGPNYQRGVLLISAGVIEGHFEGKTPREVHQRGLVLARQCPGSPGTSNPEETGLSGVPTSWSPTLFSGSGPVRLPPVPWTEETIARSPFFVRHGGHCCRGDLVGRSNILNFFWVSCIS